MRVFHIKSILLGIGIGVVLTSVISMIYLAGRNPNEYISQDYIRAEAKKLGMIEGTEVINDSPKTVSDNKQEQEKTEEVKKQEPAKPVQDKEVNAATPVKKQEEKPVQIKITVNPGDSSEKVADRLLAAGLIKDKAVFVKELSRLGLASEINIGEFKITEGTQIRGIIKVLTGK